MDAVYLVRTGANEELRYSLRSLAANIPHDRVWIVGACPTWLTGVRHLPSRANKTKWGNLPRDLVAVAKQADLSPTFSYWNDDFFALRPMPAIETYHRGPLSAYIGAKGAACSNYIMGQRQTLKLLRSWGYSEPLSYETHMPLVMDKAVAAEALERALKEGSAIRALAYRSLYGAVAGLAGEQIEDMKKTRPDAGIPEGWDWISTSDGSFANGRVGREIRAMFPEPSQYERKQS